MIARLTELIKNTNTRVLGQKLKSKANLSLYKWVLIQTTQLPEDATIKERIYNILHEPKIYCNSGNKKKFISFEKGYGFCGGINVCKCNSAYIRTFDRDTIKSEETKKKNCLEKYGVSNVMKVDSISKKQQTHRKASWNKAKSELLKQKKVEDGFLQVCNRIKDYATPLFDAAEYSGCYRKNFYNWECTQCKEIIYDHVDYGRIPRCKTCYPSKTSLGELEIRALLESFDIDNIVYNTKHIIFPLELDVYLPDHKIAIEYNGVYWHSSKFRNKDYHVSKYIECKKQGIHLIQIFEDEWHTKRQIIESRLKNILGLSKKYYARKCSVRNINSEQYKTFVDATHLRGYASASVLIGLFSDSSLLAVMSFSKSRYTNDQYELVRYCSTDTVVGGAGKLFSHFVNTYNPISVVSYADRCWSNGNLYAAIGFEDVTQTDDNTGYWYIKNNVRYHRSTFTKKRLVDLGYNSELTEFEIMEQCGYSRIYDCGNSKHLWTS